jgi:hypothetical protein
MVEFGRISRVGDPAFFVEDANLGHAGLIRESADGAVQTLAVVAQHVVRRTACDDIADPLRTQQRRLLQMLPVQADVEVTQQRKDGHHGAEQKYVELGAEARRQAQQAAS